jgi:2-(1,2-epoxy-1,2-dihydrophenyl)acetyl-CoA isomerase
VVAAESAYFLQAFRRIGLVPDGGSTYLLPRLVGKARAMEMMLLGDKIPAATALSWGLINRCVPDAELMATATTIAKELAAGPAALSAIRKLVWNSLDADWVGQLNAERHAQKAPARPTTSSRASAPSCRSVRRRSRGARSTTGTMPLGVSPCSGWGP